LIVKGVDQVVASFQATHFDAWIVVQIKSMRFVAAARTVIDNASKRWFEFNEL